MMRLAAFVLPICIAALVPHAARAQYQMVSPMLYEGPRISLQDHAKRNRPTPPQHGTPPRDPRTAPPSDTVSAATFRYTPSRERRAANLARFVTRSRAADPKGADNLAQLFAQGDIIERMRPGLAKYGLRTDDVADAYAVWWINAWQASRGRDEDVGTATVAAVRRQVVESMASTPALRSAGGAARQEMAESLLIQSLLLETAVQQAKGDPAQLDAIGRAAVQGARGMGVDLTTMTLTKNGFVPA